MENKDIKEIAEIAWKGAANSYRMYPNNKHTFSEYWNAAQSQFDHFASQQKPETIKSDNSKVNANLLEEVERLKEALRDTKLCLESQLYNDDISRGVLSSLLKRIEALTLKHNNNQ